MNTYQKRPPRLRLRKGTALLNRAAMNMLSSSGETHVMIIRDDKNRCFYLKPFKVEEGTVVVVKLYDSHKEHMGQSRIPGGHLNGMITDGNHMMQWDDKREVAIISYTL